jgi:hypothetical protein
MQIMEVTQGIQGIEGNKAGHQNRRRSIQAKYQVQAMGSISPPPSRITE